MLKRIRLDPLTALAALAVWSLGHTPLIWVVLIPWFFAIDRARTAKAAFFQGLWLSVLFNIFGFYPVAQAIRSYLDWSWPATIAAFLLLSPICQPQFVVTAPMRWLLQRHLHGKRNDNAGLGVMTALTLSFSYAGIDWLVPKLANDTLGYALYDARYMRQVADVGGAHLLTFVIYLVNDGILAIIRAGMASKERDLRRRLGSAVSESPQALLALAVTLVAFGYGVLRYQQIERLVAEPLAKVPVAIIQANIPNYEKLEAERGSFGAAEAVLTQHLRLSDRALRSSPRPSLVIWPETTYPTTFGKPKSVTGGEFDLALENFVNHQSVPLVFGGFDLGRDGKEFNTVFFLYPRHIPGIKDPAPGRSDLQTYYKSLLFPVGEFIPGIERFEILRHIFPGRGSHDRGPGPRVIEVALARDRRVNVAPIICYEALFPNFVIAAARKGSQLLLNLSNDAWFGARGALLPYALSVFRSIETRLPQARAANTGISAVILPTGDVSMALEFGVRDMISAEIPLISPVPTLMKSWGDWFGPAALVAGAILFGALWIVARRKMV